MLLLLSPAKIQNFEPQDIVRDYTLPMFMQEASELIDSIRQLSLAELAQLLEVNSNLAQLNVDRHFNWQQPFTLDNAKQSVFVFNGEVFRGLDAKSMNDSDLQYLQTNLCILSGLYGVLRPFDLIQPYRLDVSTRLTTEKGETLYNFWGDKITIALNESLKYVDNKEFILNLSSGEYTKAINKKLLNAELIDFDFLEYKNDRFKPIVIYIKKARGMMVRYVVENRIECLEDLKGFNGGGYWFNEQLSTEKKLVFVR